MTKLNQKAQSLIAYAFLLAIVVAALIAMTNVVRYSIQGRFRQSADVFGGGEQYEPGVTVITEGATSPLEPPPTEPPPTEPPPTEPEPPPEPPPTEPEPPPAEDTVDVASAYTMYEGHYNVYEENGGYFKVSYYKVTVDGKEMWLEVYESLNSSDPNDVKEVTGWVLLTNDENGVRSYASWWAGQENVTVSEVTWTDKQYVEVGYSYISEHTDKYYKYNKENFDPHNFNWRDVIGELKGETKSKTYTERLPDAEGNYVFASTNYTYVEGKGWVEQMTEVAYFNEKYGWIGSDHYDSEGRRFRSFRRVSGDKE